jgi:hypothetical protein
MTATGKNRIMIYGPKPDGTYIVEFRIANGESLAISVPAGETRVLDKPQHHGRPLLTQMMGSETAKIIAP